MTLSDVTKNAMVRAALRSNLRHWFNQASDQEIQDGLNWYARANEAANEMAGKNFSPLVTAGVISALSPNNKWKRNLIDARAVLNAVENKQSSIAVKVCTYTNNKLKAFEIARGNQEILARSPKTYAFAKNVGELDDKFVTIDVWHLRACQTRSNKRKELQSTITPLQYKVIQEETLKVAKEFGIKGYEFQAIVWVAIRNRWSNQ
jgi:hypothetical protein